MEGIEDFLKGSEPEVVAEEVTPEAETVEAEPVKAEQPRGPDGKFAPKGETDAPPASTEENAFDGKATLAERRKRQEAEARIAALEAQLSQLANPPAPPPDMFEDQEGWQQSFGQQVTQQATTHAALNAKLDTSEMLARDKFDDFDDMKALFLDLAKENPSLTQQALTDSHPWRKAYQLAKNHEKMTALGAVDVTELEAKIRAEIEAKIAAEKPQVEIPETLAASQSGRTAATNAGFEPVPLDQILGMSRRI